MVPFWVPKLKRDHNFDNPPCKLVRSFAVGLSFFGGDEGLGSLGFRT